MNSFSSRRTSLRSRLRATTEIVLLDAAEEVAARDGVDAANLQSIADRAGVAVGTIYNYFEDRDSMFEALFARRGAELLAAVDATAERTMAEPFDAQLRAFVEDLLDFFEKRRDFLRVVIDAEHARTRPASRDRRRSTLRHLHGRAAKLIGLGAASGRLRRERESFFANALVSLVRGVLVNHAAGAGPLTANASAIVEMFLRGAGR